MTQPTRTKEQVEAKRLQIIQVMCDAYCQTSGNGGGKSRYAKAMGRVLAAIEHAGWSIERRPS